MEIWLYVYFFQYSCLRYLILISFLFCFFLLLMLVSSIKYLVFLALCPIKSNFALQSASKAVLHVRHYGLSLINAEMCWSTLVAVKELLDIVQYGLNRSVEKQLYALRMQRAGRHGIFHNLFGTHWVMIIETNHAWHSSIILQ